MIAMSCAAVSTFVRSVIQLPPNINFTQTEWRSLGSHSLSALGENDFPTVASARFISLMISATIWCTGSKRSIFNMIRKELL